MTHNPLMNIPAVEPDELAYLNAFTSELSEQQLRNFISIYGGKRKKAETVLICALLGFIGAAGVHRFVIGQIGMGILYFFTAGLCFIGTIVDVVNHKKLAFEFNQQMAIESMGMISNYNPPSINVQ